VIVDLVQFSRGGAVHLFDPSGATACGEAVGPGGEVSTHRQGDSSEITCDRCLEASAVS
jgi:hypothetical protein